VEDILGGAVVGNLGDFLHHLQRLPKGVVFGIGTLLEDAILVDADFRATLGVAPPALLEFRSGVTLLTRLELGTLCPGQFLRRLRNGLRLGLDDIPNRRCRYGAGFTRQNLFLAVLRAGALELLRRGRDFRCRMAESGRFVVNVSDGVGEPMDAETLDRIFSEYDELASDVIASDHVLFLSNLDRWLMFLNRSPRLAGPVLSRLESNADMNGWIAPYRDAMGLGVPVPAFRWPREQHIRLGVQLQLCRAFVTSDVDPRVFSERLLGVIPFVAELGFKKIIDQVFRPFSRELRRYLGQVLLEPRTTKSGESFLLTESGDHIITENGDRIVIEGGGDRIVIENNDIRVTSDGHTRVTSDGSIRATAGTRTSMHGTLTALPPNWDAERATALKRIADIQDAMGRIEPFLEWLKSEPPEHGGPGHNNPPESLDTQLFRHGIEAANVFRVEVASETPHFDPIQFCGTIFRDVAKWLGWVIGKLGKKIGDYLDRFLKAAATGAGGGVGAGLGANLADADFHKLHDNLTALWQQIGHWP
jgi:hypothetical protein